MQLDEATIRNKDIHLIFYVRFIECIDIVKDLLFCKSCKIITACTKAEDLFDMWIYLWMNIM